MRTNWSGKLKVTLPETGEDLIIFDDVNEFYTSIVSPGNSVRGRADFLFIFTYKLHQRISLFRPFVNVYNQLEYFYISVFCLSAALHSHHISRLF